jgi:hypothetical protein
MEVRITAKTEEAKQRAKNYLINELGFQGEVGERVVNTVYADLDDLSRGLPDLAMMAESDWDPEPLRQELIKNGNDPKQVEIFLQWLQDEKIPFNLEVGAGRARSTRALADRYPGQRFVAGDLYAMSGEYSQTATEWAEKKLDAQKNKPDNLLILRFGIEALKYFPPKSVNQILALRPDYPLQRVPFAVRSVWARAPRR